jgi:hypothetical protein
MYLARHRSVRKGFGKKTRQDKTKVRETVWSSLSRSSVSPLRNKGPVSLARTPIKTKAGTGPESLNRGSTTALSSFSVFIMSTE